MARFAAPAPPIATALMAMAAPTAAAASGDSRVLLLPVDLAETAVRTVQFAVANIVRVGDTVVLMHVVPAYTSEFVPDMGVGGEPVMLSVRDVELEKSTVRVPLLGLLLAAAGLTLARRTTARQCFAVHEHAAGAAAAPAGRDHRPTGDARIYDGRSQRRPSRG